jgi:peptidoglycan/xylan/chitin deacetylase (PgdA/CDA1 family)
MLFHPTIFSGLGTILMLHRTAPYEKGNIIYNENMKISPEELVRLIQDLKQSKRVFLSLDDVVEIIKSGKKPKHRFVCMTLDDGYRDNLNYGYSIFKEHNVPFCIYVTNSFPNHTTNLWWYALEDLILRNKALRLLSGEKLANESLSKKNKNFLALRNEVLNKHFKDPLHFFQQLGEVPYNLPNEREKMCLTWNEIVELNKDPLTTIGCHTLNHYPLSKLDSSEVELEIINSKKEIESKLNKKISHFAFPFGSENEAGQREYQIAKSVGFDSIVTTLHGCIHSHHNTQQLNRIFLSPMRKGGSLFMREMFWHTKSAVSIVRNIF